LKQNSKNNRSETMQNEAKKYFIGFPKTSKNEAKQDVFRFILLRSENLKKSEKGTPYFRFIQPVLILGTSAQHQIPIWYPELSTMYTVCSLPHRTESSVRYCSAKGANRDLWLAHRTPLLSCVANN
jgi:hypothetical protein